MIERRLQTIKKDENPTTQMAQKCSLKNVQIGLDMGTTSPFGYDLVRLIKEKPQVKDQFDTTMQRLMSRKSRIKTVLEKALGIETSKKG
jgi:hypothetical protein